jgi:hypothetical protein
MPLAFLAAGGLAFDLVLDLRFEALLGFLVVVVDLVKEALGESF